MVSHVAAGMDGSGRISGTPSSQGQISLILSQIKGIRKQVTVLQKKLMETSDPETRKIMMKEIMDLQRTIEMLQQQIAMIEANEQRKASAREHAKLQHAMEAAQK